MRNSAQTALTLLLLLASVHANDSPVAMNETRTTDHNAILATPPPADGHAMSVPAIVGITAAVVVALCCVIFMVGVYMSRRWRSSQHADDTNKHGFVPSPGTASAQDFEQYFPKPIEPAMLQEPPARKSSRGSVLRKASSTVPLEPAPAPASTEWQSPIESSRYMMADLAPPDALQSLRSAGWQSPVESSRSLMLLQSQRIYELTGGEDGIFGSQNRIQEEIEVEIRDGTMDSYTVRPSELQAKHVDAAEWMSAMDTSRSIFETLRSTSDSDGESRDSIV
ncbi:hypothetical protein SDRG_12159 [Saprolegnia diclina VS20]|uniref:Transmembrane protein n=1 Tax=Saprolegnia diclina (strain VS20) TaxID=1156394 RepID=T0Q9E9_SAPDV|nr:hypothetical protein SDRG_12159 [Saprolegnia diclina VS20]EQC30100.1 hypothetical protein SDRG_12159 [Saprolegnia diclina VS20]|eukprot:XP_008616443.1 hypothetical protein SDRG_12159 [Saprolegnia diclina VS20]